MSARACEVDQLAARLAPATATHQSERAAARDEVVRVFRELETRIVRGLAGETLRGLPRLTPDWEAPFFGARLSGRPDVHLPMEGRSVLVLSVHGQLCMARRDASNYDGSLLQPVVVPARDSDLRAEMLPGALATIERVLAEHLRRVDAGAAQYRATRDLAARLRVALSG